jgi:DNA modification methylase
MVWQQDGITVYQGDCLEILPTFDAGSVNCCVTSPPYWGLRDYGHDDQLGLESTPEEYVAKMVSVFREVRRVLRDDGTLWLNLGDSYGHGTNAGRQQSSNPGVGANCVEAQNSVGRNGLKAKDLVGIPWRVAFALQADGWYLRQDIIWHNKPNAGECDRPLHKVTRVIFLLSKSARYYYDADAIKEPASYDGRKDTTMKGSSKGTPEGQTPNTLVKTGGERWPSLMPNGDPARNKRSVWTVATKPYPQAHFATFPPELITLASWLVNQKAELFWIVHWERNNC